VRRSQPSHDETNESKSTRHRTSQRKRDSVRRNALAGRGPVTPAGRARAARNARRHGLSAPDLWDADAEIDALARRICPPGAGEPAREAHLLGLARRIAEAQVDLMRVRRARHDLIASEFADPHYRTSKNLMARIAMLREAGEMIKRGDQVPPAMAHAIHHRPRGAEKFAVILAEIAPQLIAMDRYERRALWRRKHAVRAYDAAATGRAAPRRRPGAQKNQVLTKRTKRG
jgi:hypothetical protein